MVCSCLKSCFIQLVYKEQGTCLLGDAVYFHSQGLYVLEAEFLVFIFLLVLPFADAVISHNNISKYIFLQMPSQFSSILSPIQIIQRIYMHQNLDYLCQFLKQLTPGNQYDTITEFVRSSLQFYDLNASHDSIDFTECSDLDKKTCPSTTPKPPLITFTQLIGDQKHKSKQPLSKNSLQEPQKPKGKHQRGPSKIKDILMSLRAGVITDLQKIADDLLNDPFLHQQLSGSEIKDEQKVITKIKEKIDSMENEQNATQIQLDDGANDEDDNEENGEQDDFSPCTNFEEKKRRRKVRKVSKLNGYNLDIIEEQSYEQITPDKQLLNSVLEHRQKSWSSASSGLEQLNLKYESIMGIQSKDMSNSSFRKMNFKQCQSEWVSENGSETQMRSRYSKGNEFQIIDEHLEGLDDYDDSQEKAIMDSWNRLCQRIIQKHLLPIEYNKLEKQQDAGLFSKLKERRRKQKQSGVNALSPNYSDICKQIEFGSEILYDKENCDRNEG